MSTEYVTALIGVFGSLCAVIALVWAVKHRQLKTEDREMYEAMADDEPDYTALASRSPSQIPRSGRWLFVAAFTALFSLIGWLIVETVRVTTSPPVQPPPARQRPASE